MNGELLNIKYITLYFHNKLLAPFASNPAGNTSLLILRGLGGDCLFHKQAAKRKARVRFTSQLLL
jgi:hypothetical protein